jgi:hypothetical protein
VQSLDMLTINEELENEGDIVEIIWKALTYFPEGIWKGVNYVGNVNVKSDLKIKTEEENCGGFIFPRLIRKIRKMRSMFRIDDLLLGVTHNPVIFIYYQFEVDRFRRSVNLVHDYVSNDVGVISLFDTDKDAPAKVTAHGLGHSQGLEHHADPVDLMYVELLHGKPIEIDGFCDECKRKLKKRMG